MNKNFYFNIYLLINHFYLSYIFHAVCYAIRISVIYANMPSSGMRFLQGTKVNITHRRTKLRIWLPSGGLSIQICVGAILYNLLLIIKN